MIYKISHRTTYRYAYPVSYGKHVACLKPRSFAHNELVHSTLHIHPKPNTLTERVDYFGNLLCFFTVQEPHKELVVEARSEVVKDSDAVRDARLSLPWEASTGPVAQDHRPEGLEA